MNAPRKGPRPDQCSGSANFPVKGGPSVLSQALRTAAAHGPAAAQGPAAAHGPAAPSGCALPSHPQAAAWAHHTALLD